MTDITELAQSLKAAAEKATPGEWRRASTQFNEITATPFMLGRKEVMIAGASEKRDAEFIALANPANILALVDAACRAALLESGKKRDHQITSSMAKDIAFKLGAELNDEEADIFADGYNTAMLQGKADGTLTNEGTIQAGNSPVIPDGSASMLRRWLAFGRGMQNAGSQLPRNLIAETESMLAAAPQDAPALNLLQSVDSVVGRWVPVSEWMPEDSQWCAVITEYGYYVQCWADGQGWLGDDISIPNVDVTHWMPLPNSPQEPKP